MLYNAKDARKYIEKYEFDVILTVSTSPLRYFLEECEDFKVHYKDDMSYIFVRTS